MGDCQHSVSDSSDGSDECLYLEGSRITGCSAYAGGGLFVWSKAEEAIHDITLSNVTMIENKAHSAGSVESTRPCTQRDRKIERERRERL